LSLNYHSDIKSSKTYNFVMFDVSSLHRLKDEADLNNTHTATPVVPNLYAASFCQVSREVLMRTMIILNKTCIRINL
jgi:hypothetical protein